MIKPDEAAEIAVPPTDQHPIILYDGVCVFCSGFVRFVIERDPAARFRFASMQSEAGQQFLAELGLPLDDWDSNVLIENGVPYLKSASFLRIVRYLSGPWPRLLAPAHFVPQAVRDWLYDRLARNRYRLFGRRNSCLVPDPEVRTRFFEHLE
jgi:predicted DCC family thiol-disulfide oxidoreductase YuxK